MSTRAAKSAPAASAAPMGDGGPGHVVFGALGIPPVRGACQNLSLSLKQTEQVRHPPRACTRPQRCSSTLHALGATRHAAR
jgi:hypothetical protein